MLARGVSPADSSHYQTCLPETLGRSQAQAWLRPKVSGRSIGGLVRVCVLPGAGAPGQH